LGQHLRHVAADESGAAEKGDRLLADEVRHDPACKPIRPPWLRPGPLISEPPEVSNDRCGKTPESRIRRLTSHQPGTIFRAVRRDAQPPGSELVGL
ncbi:MAG TPA: hypothetical protein VIQ53_11675, partial [Inquilinus sp.]